MSKKILLLALAVTSMAMYALPAVASAAELHLEGVEKITGDSTAGTLTAEGEPTTTCETGDIEGTVSAGGTTGTLSLDLTGCHSNILGATVKCRTAGSPLDNTMKGNGTFHLITTSSGPAMLVTLETVTEVCAGISNTIIHGSLIGTITSPKCGESSNRTTINFASVAGNPTTQEHELYTGVNYDLTETTGEGGAAKTSALTTLVHLESLTTGKLNCT